MMLCILSYEKKNTRNAVMNLKEGVYGRKPTNIHEPKFFHEQEVAKVPMINKVCQMTYLFHINSEQ